MSDSSQVNKLGSRYQFVDTLIVSVPEFRFVKQLVLVQIVKLGDFKTPISL